MSQASTAGGDVQLVLELHDLNGEGPQWADGAGALWFVDMRRPSLNRFFPAGGRHDWWEMPDWIGCYGLLEDGRVAAALRSGLHLFDPQDGSMRMLAPAPYDPRRFCFNDGGCDRAGRFYAGPMYQPLKPGDGDPGAPRTAPVFRYDGARGWSPATPGVRISNGLAFSPDGRTLYHSDTPTKTIWACPYDPDTGEVGEGRVFARVEEGGDDGGPDGAVVDRDGFYTCAVFGAGMLKRFDPDGRLERTIELPVRYPTMPALGGPDRSTLYVTSASYPWGKGRVQDHPWAGGLLALEAPAPGPPTSYMHPPEGAST